MDVGPLATLAGVVVTSILGAIGAIYVARAKSKTDIGSSINAGFVALTDQLQQERSDLSVIITELRAENEVLIERNRALDRRNDLLEWILQREGVPFPPLIIGAQAEPAERETTRQPYQG